MLFKKILNNKIARNAYWIIICKVIQSIFSFVISMLTARYLGPANFGVLGYAESLVLFAGPIMKLGINSVIVQDLIDHKDEEGKILGTCILASTISAFTCILGIGAFVFLMNRGETDTLIVCLLYSTFLISQSLELIIYWFQAHYLSKYYSIVSLCVYVAVTGYKVFLLATGKSVFWFAVSNSIDYLLIGITLHIIYKRMGGQKLSVSTDTFRRIITKSKYYIISGLMVVICGQTDRIMLKNMLGDTIAGYYNAAAAALAFVGFFFTALIDSMRPSVFENKANSDTETYEKSVIKLYSIVVFSAIAVSSAYCLLARPIISIMYGAEYLPAIGTIRILTWYMAFSYYGGSKDVWVLSEGKQKYLIITYASGAAANIILNLLLIPVWGANGAAVASLITQFLVNVIVPWTLKPLRHTNKLLLKALNPKVLTDIVKHL